MRRSRLDYNRGWVDVSRPKGDRALKELDIQYGNDLTEEDLPLAQSDPPQQTWRRRSDRYRQVPEEETDPEQKAAPPAEPPALQSEGEAGAAASADPEPQAKDQPAEAAPLSKETDPEAEKTVSPSGGRNVASSIQHAGASRIRAMNPSRIPPQARRMEEAAPRVRPAEIRIPMRPERADREKPDVTMRVGYAPGRMGEGLTRQVRPAAPDRVRTYPENRYAPAGQRAEDRASASVRKSAGNRKQTKKFPWRILLILLAVLVLSAVGVFVLLPKDHAIRQAAERLLSPLTGSRPASTEPPEVITGLTVTGNENAVAPTDITIAMTASRSVSDIRLVNEDGDEILTDQAMGDNAEDTVWILTLPLEDGYEGLLRLQVRIGEGDWQDTSWEIPVAVASLPELPTEQPTESSEEAGTPEPDETPANTDPSEMRQQEADGIYAGGKGTDPYARGG